jgi:outer membrane murein-binding lipoprotein Lpp
MSSGQGISHSLKLSGRITMAHIQPKSAKAKQHNNKVDFVEQSAKETRTQHGERAIESNVTTSVSQASSAVDEGGSWQLKFVLGAIALGVLMLILKTIGLF